MTAHTFHYMTVIRNHVEAVREIFCDIYGSSRKKEIAVLMRLCYHQACFGVVSFDADEPAGFILLQQAGHTADVIELGVRARLRRQGIGRDLLEHGSPFNEHGIKRVMLEVEVINKAAYKLYRSSGFELWENVLIITSERKNL